MKETKKLQHYKFSVSPRRRKSYKATMILAALVLVGGAVQARPFIDKTTEAPVTYQTMLDYTRAQEQEIERLQDELIIIKNQRVRDVVGEVIQPDLTGWNCVPGEATAYSPKENVSGMEGDNITSLGEIPNANIFAVDPERIPYGSQMIIILSDGTIHTGVAGDTGGAMRSAEHYLVDIYKDTYAEVVEFGRQDAMILWKEVE